MYLYEIFIYGTKLLKLVTGCFLVVKRFDKKILAGKSKFSVDSHWEAELFCLIIYIYNIYIYIYNILLYIYIYIYIAICIAIWLAVCIIGCEEGM